MRSESREYIIDYLQDWIQKGLPKIKVIKIGVSKTDGQEWIVLLPAGGKDSKFPESIDYRLQVISSSTSQTKSYNYLVDLKRFLSEQYLIEISPPSGKESLGDLKITSIIIDTMIMPLSYVDGAYRFSANYILKFR